MTRLQFERRIVELREQFRHLHKAMGRLAESDETCKRLMTAPGVGPMVALSFWAGVDEPARFGRSRSVPAHLGLTPSRYQSGEIDRNRGISKCGDAGIRWILVEAVGIVLRVSKKSSPLKTWGLAVARRRCMAKATVAVARHPAVILHRMRVDNMLFRWEAEAA